MWLICLLLALAVAAVLWQARVPSGNANDSREPDRKLPGGSSRALQAISFDDLVMDEGWRCVGRDIRTKVVGVSFENPDGQRREIIIQTLCKPNDALVLVPYPNPYDVNAVAVCRLVTTENGSGGIGEMLGNLRKELAADICPRLKSGQVLYARIKDITGDLEPDPEGEDDDYNAGVNIEIVQFEKVTAAKA